MEKTNRTVIDRALEKLEVAIQKKFNEVTGLLVKNDTDTAEIQLDVGTVAHVLCSVKKSNGMLVLRSESTPDGMSEQELDDLGAEIIEKVGARKTSYDGVLTVMKAVSFDLESEDAERHVFNEVMTFIHNIIQFKRKLGGINTENFSDLDESGSAEREAEDDPFGFDAILADEEGERNQEERSVALDEKELGFDEEQENDADNSKREASQNATDIETENASDGAENRLLKDMLSELDEEEPIDLPQKPEEDAIPVSPVDETAEKISEEVNTVPRAGDFIEDDQHELVRRTREYKDMTQQAMDQICQIIANLYNPVYQFSLELCRKNSEIVAMERDLQQTVGPMRERQRLLEEAEAQLAIQQQALVRDRANMNSYMEGVHSTLQDYNNKCRTVNEQAEQIRQLNYRLTESQKMVAQLQALADGSIDGSASNQSVDSLLKANERQKRQIEQMTERLNKYSKVVDTFRECQQKWEKQEAEYKKLIQSLKNSSSMSAAAKKEIEDANNRILELEAEVAKQQQIADEQSEAADKMRARAVLAEDKERELEAKLTETTNKSNAMERRAKRAESDLASEQLKNDVSHNAKQLCDLFRNIGIELETVPGGSEMILQGCLNDCQVIIDVKVGVIYINKPAKKPSRFAKKIEQLNKQDIKTSYSIGEREISCRTIYASVNLAVMQANEIITEMAQFT